MDAQSSSSSPYGNPSMRSGNSRAQRLRKLSTTPRTRNSYLNLNQTLHITRSWSGPESHHRAGNTRVTHVFPTSVRVLVPSPGIEPFTKQVQEQLFRLGARSGTCGHPTERLLQVVHKRLLCLIITGYAGAHTNNPKTTVSSCGSRTRDLIAQIQSTTGLVARKDVASY